MFQNQKPASHVSKREKCVSRSVKGISLRNQNDYHIVCKNKFDVLAHIGDEKDTNVNTEYSLQCDLHGKSGVYKKPVKHKQKKHVPFKDSACDKYQLELHFKKKHRKKSLHQKLMQHFVHGKHRMIKNSALCHHLTLSCLQKIISPKQLRIHLKCIG